MKKSIKVLLCLALCLSLFTACAKGSENSAGSSEPEIIEPEYNPAFLTGLEKGDDYNDNSRVVAIMVNNLSAARPQRGLSDADVLVESKVEGGITRFMALYQDYTKVDGDIGPVRSGRDQFLQIAMPLNALYLHIGRSGVTQTYIDTYDYNNSDCDGSTKMFWYRDRQRKKLGYATEHTAFATEELISGVFKKYDYETEAKYGSPFLYFANYNDYENGIREMNGEDALSIAVIHSQSYKTYFNYNAETGTYDMSQYNSSKGGVQKTIDENNDKQLTFENVIILFADIAPYYYPGGNVDAYGRDKGDPDYQHVDFLAGGFGLYFSEGKAEKLTWSKGEATQFLKLYGEDGEPLMVNCGKSYIGIVDYDEYKNFAYSATGEDLSGGKYIPSGASQVYGEAEKEMGEDVADYEISSSSEAVSSSSKVVASSSKPVSSSKPADSSSKADESSSSAPSSSSENISSSNTQDSSDEVTPPPATEEPTPMPTPEEPAPTPEEPTPTPDTTPTDPSEPNADGEQP